MKKLNKLIQTLHKLLGTLLSCVLLMWFLTGIVMMYHGSFPRPDRNGRQGKLEPLSLVLNTLPDLDSLRISQTPQSLDRYMGHTAFHVNVSGEVQDLTPEGKKDVVVVNESYRQKVVKAWCDSPILEVDTLKDLNQWVPFSSNYEQLPILRFRFQDPEHHVLYMGLNTAKVLQFTTREQRFWAWIGPIPHWIYFTWLRTNAPLWNSVVTWTAAICCLMLISGLWNGVRIYRNTHRKTGKFSPYKKKWYHYHYVLGFAFGLFGITYAFSGLMSLNSVPEWISKASLDFSLQREMQTQNVGNYVLDYRKAIEAYPGTTLMEWSHFSGTPLYRLTQEDGTVVVLDARKSQPTPLALSQDEIQTAVQSIYQAHGVNLPDPRIEQIHQAEAYYRNFSDDAYPVWKVYTQDPDNGVLYVNPRDASMRYVNNTSRWSYWMYSALHSFRMPFIMHHEWLRQLIIWIIMLGGASVSITGIYMGIRYIIRTLRNF